MVRKITTLDEAPVDVVEAVKRGFIHRGFIPRKYQRNDPTSDGFDPSKAFSPDKTAASQDSEAGQKKGPEESDSANPDKPSVPPSRKNKITSTNPDIAVIDSEEGSQEAAKDPDEPEPGEVHEKLIELTENAQDILFTADTVFPFTMFPDTITLDREKLTVIERFFFRVAKVVTVPITSMISADANVGPFFGSIHMTSKYFIDNTHVVKFLWRHDAVDIHRLLQGFIIAQEKGVDVSGVEKEDLKVLLKDLGHGTNE